MSNLMQNKNDQPVPVVSVLNMFFICQQQHLTDNHMITLSCSPVILGVLSVYEG